MPIDNCDTWRAYPARRACSARARSLRRCNRRTNIGRASSASRVSSARSRSWKYRAGLIPNRARIASSFRPDHRGHCSSKSSSSVNSIVVTIVSLCTEHPTLIRHAPPAAARDT